MCARIFGNEESRRKQRGIGASNTKEEAPQGAGNLPAMLNWSQAMGNAMTHPGYSAKVETSEEDRCFVGRVAGIRAIVGFHADTVTGLRKAFRAAVENYIDLARQRGEQPEKPFSGRVMLRLPGQLHARVNSAAERSGVSVHRWATQALERAAQAQ